MIQLELTAEEQQVLVETLNADISDMSMEISRTDSHDYREALKERKQMLTKVVQALH